MLGPWDSFQWNNVHTRFREDRAPSFEVEMWDIHRAWRSHKTHSFLKNYELTVCLLAETDGYVDTQTLRLSAPRS
jgi:hypothetical protein